jgi:regulator of sigma E protease
MTVIIFLGVLFLLVLVHEFGHFIVAKKVGMRVDEFGIGFPPRIFGKKFGETLYSLNIFPIGGFVKIFGEDALTEGEPLDTSGAFTSKSKWAQAAVLIAGVSMNILFAWFLFTIAFTIGVERQVEDGVATESSSLMIAGVLEDSPASNAGLVGGERVTALVSGTSVLESLSPSEFSQFIEETKGEELTLVFTKDGQEEQIALQSNQVLTDGVQHERIGVSLSLTDTVSVPLHEAVVEGFVYSYNGLIAIVAGVSNLILDSVLLRADFSSVAGPVGIVSLVGEATAFGFTTLLMFTGFISLNLAVINLLPFPALDGGRLLFVAIEAVKGTAIKPKYVQILNTAGFALLIVLMIAITYSDISKLV